MSFIIYIWFLSSEYLNMEEDIPSALMGEVDMKNVEGVNRDVFLENGLMTSDDFLLHHQSRNDLMWVELFHPVAWRVRLRYLLDTEAEGIVDFFRPCGPLIPDFLLGGFAGMNL